MTHARWSLGIPALVIGTAAMLGSCGVSGFTVAPAARDRPVIWMQVVNRDAVPGRIEFTGSTRGHPTSATFDIAGCWATVVGTPIEEEWRIAINATAALHSSDVNPVQADHIAALEIVPGGDGRVASFGPGSRPADPQQPVGCAADQDDP